MLAIRLPEKLEKRLDRLAKRSGRSKTWYAREALIRYIEDLEDLQIAEERLRAVLEGRDKTVPLEEVMKRYGLED
jgi:RHH-type transcriptional regulator, rel operon repressor / antitoxin RelB